MGRYTGPKNRIARREGMDLGYKTVGSKSHASLLRRLNIGPGQHGAKGKRKQSAFGVQLREKQKMKRMYGLLERQFRKNFQLARKFRGNTGDMLVQFLELRLDNVLYRLGLSPTRSLARQLVSHGHTVVSGNRVNIPSYMVKVGDVITLKPKGLEIPAVKKQLEDKTYVPAEWLARKGPVGNIVRLPERTDVKEDLNTQLIVEYYSR
ncbi:MAG: 30S ribosomal protein S4 [Patescibacteria group bacterium]